MTLLTVALDDLRAFLDELDRRNGTVDTAVFVLALEDADELAGVGR